MFLVVSFGMRFVQNDTVGSWLSNERRYNTDVPGMMRRPTLFVLAGHLVTRVLFRYAGEGEDCEGHGVDLTLTEERGDSGEERMRGEDHMWKRWAFAISAAGMWHRR